MRLNITKKKRHIDWNVRYNTSKNKCRKCDFMISYLLKPFSNSLDPSKLSFLRNLHTRTNAKHDCENGFQCNRPGNKHCQHMHTCSGQMRVPPKLDMYWPRCPNDTLPHLQCLWLHSRTCYARTRAHRHPPGSEPWHMQILSLMGIYTNVLTQYMDRCFIGNLKV